MLWQDYYKILRNQNKLKRFDQQFQVFQNHHPLPSLPWLAILSPLKHLFNIFLQKQIMFSLMQVGPSFHLLGKFRQVFLAQKLVCQLFNKEASQGKNRQSAIHTNKQKLSGKTWHYTHLVHRLITKHDLPAYRRQARPSFSWFSWALQWSTRISTWPPPHLVQKCSFWTAAVRGIFEKAETAQWSQTASADGEKEG